MDVGVVVARAAGDGEWQKGQRKSPDRRDAAARRARGRIATFHEILLGSAWGMALGKLTHFDERRLRIFAL
jgi:hypothetical protein